MRIFQAKEYNFETIRSADHFIPYPYLRSSNGDREMMCVSPLHGRSFVIGENEQNRYVVSKGDGLSYTNQSFLNTIEMGIESWGLLTESAAIRDFNIGIDIQNKGIKTNEMEYVLKIDYPIKFQNQEVVYPYLLQYNVECPYRICDAAFMSGKEIKFETDKWKKLNSRDFKENYMIAANILINNLCVMHDNNILHNAIHIQNYTWALELLDFELARTPNFPYNNEEDEKRFPVLYHREIIQTYEVINYIAWCLKEEISYKKVDELFLEYGFNLEKYK